MNMNLLVQILQIFSLSSLVKCWTQSPEYNKSERQKYGKSLANCSYEYMKVDVYILSAGNPSAEGLVKLMVLPLGHELYTICYPRDHYDSSRQVAVLSHVVCRQLGYMSYSRGYQQIFPSGMESVSVQANMLCRGDEQSLGHCSWSGLTIDHCNSVLATHCSSCHSVLEASEGFISNPGYPHAYLYNVLCQWDIIVPEGDILVLTFRHFSLPKSRWGSINCVSGQPHVEIIYETQGTNSVHRYCTFNYVETLKVPDRKVQVRFYSGIYPGNAEDMEKDYGFNLLFQAEQVETSSFQSFKIIVIVGIFVSFFAMMMLCYCCRKWRPRNRMRNQTFGQTASAVGAGMREPLRTVTFHQRPDRIGMNMDKENLIVLPQKTHVRRSSGFGLENPASDSSDSCNPNEGLVHIRGTEALMYNASACCGTPHRPRNEFPIHQNRSRLISKLKTSLLSKLSSDSANSSIRSSSASKHGSAAPTVIPQVTNFHIYNSFETTPSDSAVAAASPHEFPRSACGDGRARSGSNATIHVSESPFRDGELSGQTFNTPKKIPTIVVECVDDSPELYECPISPGENQYLKPSP